MNRCGKSFFFLKMNSGLFCLDLFESGNTTFNRKKVVALSVLEESIAELRLTIVRDGNKKVAPLEAKLAQ